MLDISNFFLHLGNYTVNSRQVIGVTKKANYMLQWLPNHKGLVNGIVLAGFGGGAFIFDQVQTIYINPHNLSPDLPVSPGSLEK